MQNLTIKFAIIGLYIELPEPKFVSGVNFQISVAHIEHFYHNFDAFSFKGNFMKDGVP